MTTKEIRTALDHYLIALKRLKELGVVRTERNVQGDYAEWLVAQKLGLELSQNPVQKGWDGQDAKGKLYQIKARTVRDLSAPTSFDGHYATDPSFDKLVCVFFDYDLNVLQILCLPKCIVSQRARIDRKGKYRLRWSAQSLKELSEFVVI